MMSGVDLADFLLARIAEDEAEARAAANEAARLDEAFEIEDPKWRRWSRPFASVSSTGPVADFIARQTPTRVLAECDAKRQIVELYDAQAPDSGWLVATEQALRLLALPYSDHPDYREEWRP